MRRMFGTVLSALLLASPALADGPKAPLAPGKAAGLHAAQTNTQLGKLGLAAGIALGAVSLYLILGTHYHQPGGSDNNHAAIGTK